MSVVALGELLIDFVAMEAGVTVGDASGFIKAPGGAPANVAVAVARLGHPSAFLGQVGNDPFGQFLADLLAAEGVDVSGLRFSDAARTMLAFVALAEDGERSFQFYRNPSADMLYRPEDVDSAVLSAGRIFHFGSISLIDEPARSATLSAVRQASQAGQLISYDPNLRLALWPSADDARTGMRTGFEYAHIIKISDEELEFLTGGHDARALWHDATRIIAVTHGAGGATLVTASETFHHPGYRVMAVDTTGAGDAFVAGLLAGILEQEARHDEIADVPALLPLANATGALTTTTRGGIPALPLRQQVDAFMRKHQG